MPDYLRTPWSTDKVLDRCIYVLTGEYLAGSGDHVFSAIVGTDRNLVTVDAGEVGTFLEQHKDDTFITFDAVSFHRACLRAVVGSPIYRNAVWMLSSQSRLWDVGLLERRIRHAHSGEVNMAMDMERLWHLYKHWLDTDFSHLRSENKVLRLRKILVRQLDWAVRELPLFKKLLPPSPSDFLDNISNEEYCNEIADKAARSMFEQNTGRDVREARPLFDKLKAHRRVNLVLSAPNGPLGIGLDLQSELLADCMNPLGESTIDNNRMRDIAANLFAKRQMGMQNPSSSWEKKLSSCFKWVVDDAEDKTKVIGHEKRGYLQKNDQERKNSDKKGTFRSELLAHLNHIARDIRIPLEFHRQQDGTVSLRYGDWLKYRHYDPLVTAWTDMEAASYVETMLRSQVNTFPKYKSFPAFCSASVEIISDNVSESFLFSRGIDSYLVEIRFNDIDFRSSLAMNVAKYGILPEMRQHSYDEDPYSFSMQEYVSRAVKQIMNRFNERRQNNVSERDWEKALKAWETVPDERHESLINLTLRSCLFHDTVDTTRLRLLEAGIKLDASDMSALRSLLWDFFVSVCAPQYRHSHNSSGLDYNAPGVNMQKHELSGDITDDIRNSLRIADFLFEVALTNLCYKTGMSLFQLRRVLKERICNPNQSSLPLWTIIDHLDKIDRQCADILLSAWGENPPKEIRSPDLDVLYRSNSVSSAGRIGRPIHYANSVSADYELFRQDLPLQIAFALQASNHQVTWVSSREIIVKLNSGNEEAQLFAIAMTVRKKAAELFRTASVKSSGFHDWLARGLCTCQVVDSWPNGRIRYSVPPDFYSLPFKQQRQSADFSCMEDEYDPDDFEVA